jgi:hypothetical protein
LSNPLYKIRDQKYQINLPSRPSSSILSLFALLAVFCTDPDTSDAKLVFNRTLTLKETWAKIQQKRNSRTNRL